MRKGEIADECSKMRWNCINYIRYLRVTKCHLATFESRCRIFSRCAGDVINGRTSVTLNDGKKWARIYRSATRFTPYCFLTYGLSTLTRKWWFIDRKKRWTWESTKLMHAKQAEWQKRSWHNSIGEGEKHGMFVHEMRLFCTTLHAKSCSYHHIISRQVKKRLRAS